MPHDFSKATLSGKFELIRRIGHGGMATVYEATNLRVGKRVAVKILNPEFITNPTMLARFEQEARGVARLDHPNIVEVLDYAVDGDLPYIVMAYLPGKVLSDEIRDIPPMPWTRAVDLCIQVCAALTHAHDQGILHRDIKPNNIFLCDAPAPDHVKLLDFGIAKVLEVAAGEPNPGTNPSQTPGTPEYMAPEQAMGATCDARTDVYAVGVTLYRLVTGQTPFHGVSPSATLALHVHGALRSPRTLRPDLPAAVETIILRALARLPEERWQSTEELRQALVDLRGSPLRLAATTPASSNMSLPIPAADAHSWDTLDRQERFLRRRRAGTAFTGVALGLSTFMLLSLFQMPGVELFARVPEPPPQAPRTSLPPEPTPLPLLRPHRPSVTLAAMPDDRNTANATHTPDAADSRNDTRAPDRSTAPRPNTPSRTGPPSRPPTPRQVVERLIRAHRADFKSCQDKVPFGQSLTLTLDLKFEPSSGRMLSGSARGDHATKSYAICAVDVLRDFTFPPHGEPTIDGVKLKL